MEWEHIFRYPNKPHERSHEPKGYVNYQSMKPWLRDEFSFRCVYCLEREEFGSDGANRFAVEHTEPKGANPAKQNDYDNVVYACTRCNTLKGTKRILNPAEIPLPDVLRCDPDGVFIGITVDGQDLIETLQLNDSRRVKHRLTILTICNHASKSGADPEITQIAIGFLQFPVDLPDLRTLVPPGGNAKPDGVNDCYFVQREQGRLPNWY